MFPLSRRKLLTSSLGGAGALALLAMRGRLGANASSPPALPAGDPLVRTTRALGTAVSITVVHPDHVLADRAIDAAFAEVRQIEQVLSIYLPDSQVSRLNREGEVQAHPHLLNMLSASLDLSRRSDGAFDITVQPLWELYAGAAKNRQIPADAEIESVRKFVDWTAIDVQGSTVRFLKPGTKITFNGIAQGYATNCARNILKSHGIEHALVDVGELTTIGNKPPGEKWKVGIQHPRVADAFVAVAMLQDRGLATSGDYETTFSEDKAYNHIFEPATGRSPTEFSSVSIAAPTAAEADGLSTAVFVLGFEKGMKLLQSREGFDALFVFKDGRTATTNGFPIQS